MLKQLLRSLTLSDDQILDLVYKFNDVVEETGETLNVEALFSVVSAIMSCSIGAADTTLKTEEDSKAIPTNFEPPTQTLKLISCQIIHGHDGEDEYHSYAHERTMWILEQLKAYSWGTKAVIGMAAFALEYGNFWHLSQVPRDDNLGTSLALLNHAQVQALDENRSAKICDYNLVVNNVFQTVKNIVELERVVKKGYDQKDVPTLSKAMHQFPVFVYWAILTIVACAPHINFLLGYSEGKYELYNIRSKISMVLSKLRALLATIREEIAQKEDDLTTSTVVDVFFEDSDSI